MELKIIAERLIKKMVLGFAGVTEIPFCRKPK
jgi:hypothetical protein